MAGSITRHTGPLAGWQRVLTLKPGPIAPRLLAVLAGNDAAVSQADPTTTPARA